MSLDNFKIKVREYFSILSVTHEISDNEWLNFAKKLESEKPLNRAQANSLLHKHFPDHKFTVLCLDSIDNSDVNALLLMAINANKSAK